MPLITDGNIISSLRAAPSLRNFMKPSAASEGAGTFHSLWKLAGNPAAGVNPPLFSAGAGYVPTKATLGAYPLTDAGVNGHLAVLRLAAQGAVAGSLIIYDRLWACSGFGTVVTTLQSITTPGSLPTGRDPNTGQDVEPFIEVYTAPGATGATWTLNGTDGLGNTGRTWTYAHPANAESIGQMVPMFPGTAAMMGIRQATGLTCSVSSGTAGDVGITLLRRIGEVNITSANIGDVMDALRNGLETVYNDSCIAKMVLCTTTTTGLILGKLSIGEGV